MADRSTARRCLCAAGDSRCGDPAFTLRVFNLQKPGVVQQPASPFLTGPDSEPGHTEQNRATSVRAFRFLVKEAPSPQRGAKTLSPKLLPVIQRSM
uniref:Uncharacterized protein n=1 Tax=Salarias fasciatus TaxID=181472 RepID=A0A672HZH8_SALFA